MLLLWKDSHKCQTLWSKWLAVWGHKRWWLCSVHVSPYTYTYSPVNCNLRWIIQKTLIYMLPDYHVELGSSEFAVHNIVCYTHTSRTRDDYYSNKPMLLYASQFGTRCENHSIFWSDRHWFEMRSNGKVRMWTQTRVDFSELAWSSPSIHINHLQIEQYLHWMIVRDFNLLQFETELFKIDSDIMCTFDAHKIGSLNDGWSNTAVAVQITHAASHRQDMGKVNASLRWNFAPTAYQIKLLLTVEKQVERIM